ncbi:Complex I intermediate-associated protein 84, mitochondrial [Madurella mycetomatis]|uniref:Complex I intermediate-associated protein 84, mitochondrial n=1 Tax=Madurella mycetomatis TaxID=100816 RepID=A0A175W6N4_9PEZI|nr:Complex I intermediate-associated protein 84, mitochondrial [Madurella mycetomatis]
MRSQLTRNVYRRLLAGHGSLRPCPAPSGCRLVASSYPRPLPLLTRRQPCRTFFGIFQKPPRQLKEPDLEPGYDVLLHFRSLETENARPPAREGLLRGWTVFIRHKKRYHKVLNPTQAFLAVRLLRHLLTEDSETGGHPEDLSFEDLRTALEIAAKPPKGKPDNHLELAKLVYGEINRRIQSLRELGLDEDMIREASGGKDRGDFQLFLTALTQYGASLEASERYAEYLQKLRQENRVYKGVKSLWTLVLRGLAKEGREEELLREYKKAEDAGVEYMPPVHEIMTAFYARRDRVEETKQWFEKPIYANWMRSTESYMEVVRFALRTGEQEWLQPIFEQLINSNPQKPWWDVVFQWAVLVLDKGVEDIKQMMATMARHSEGQKDLMPDATTIDVLIQAAIEKKNPYLAERFLSLGAELGIAPKSTTYILQMDYRLDAKDLSGVQAIYDKLLRGEVEVRNDEDLPVLNKYLRTLCSVPEPNIERILDITADLEQRHATLEPETVVSLCMAFLRSDNQYDVIDTLSLHTVSYSLEERAQVRKAFVEYCLDKKISTARVWDCYSLLRQFFPETEPEHRVRLMDAFFERRRPDMACYIFGHMRAHGNPAQRPTSDIYVRCLEGLGRHPDADSLRMVHNMLKMDTTVQMDTRLCNALMLAYAACDDPSTAIEFWRDITNSAEGPSYNSLEIVFWVCELEPFGDRTARQIWQKVQRMDLDVPPNVFWAYCGAIAGSGHVEEVMRLIRGTDASVGYPPGMMTLGVTYNALPGTQRKRYFEDWAKAEYPEIWAQLENKGRKETIAGTKFNIVRTMKA